MLGALLRCRADLANRCAEVIKFALRIVQLATDNLQTHDERVNREKPAVKRSALASMLPLPDMLLARALHTMYFSYARLSRRFSRTRGSDCAREIVEREPRRSPTRRRADADTADSDREPAMLMARLRQAIERPTTALGTWRRFGNASLQPVPRHRLDHPISVRNRGRRLRGKRLRAGEKASALARDREAAVIQARPSDA